MSSTKNPGRFAGLLYLLASIIGVFAMIYVPGKLIVDGNAAATANNIAASETLFRLAIAGELIGQAGFIFVALALYDLLKGVNRRHASLMVTLIKLLQAGAESELRSEPRRVGAAGEAMTVPNEKAVWSVRHNEKGTGKSSPLSAPLLYVRQEVVEYIAIAGHERASAGATAPYRTGA
jgi:hypothetical protein